MIEIPLFPRGCHAAISMTYDDGIDAHLDHAISDLEASGLVGTFYVPTRMSADDAWHRRPMEWRDAARRGHEIGNHTQHHPCSPRKPTTRPGGALEDYDLARMETELKAATADIREVIGEFGPLSFAYTCCQDFVGPEKTSFRPIADRLFIANRGGGGRHLVDPRACDFTFVNSWVMKEDTQLDSVIEFIEQTIAEKKWAVLMFHGVGGGHHIDVSRELHQSICRKIAALRDRICCATFAGVAAHIRAITNRPFKGF